MPAANPEFDVFGPRAERAGLRSARVFSPRNLISLVASAGGTGPITMGGRRGLRTDQFGRGKSRHV